jgi:hypothetical protein
LIVAYLFFAVGRSVLSSLVPRLNTNYFAA